MAGTRGLHALMLVLIMFMAPLAGCFGENSDGGIVTVDDAMVTPQVMTAGVFQGVTIAAEQDLSAFVPYLVKDDESGFVVNSYRCRPARWRTGAIVNARSPSG